MRGGKLRNVVTLQRQDDAPRNDYGEQPPAWTDIATTRASIESIRGKEYMGASGESAQVTHRVRIRYGSDWASLRPRDRVAFGSRLFDIQSVINPDNRRRDMELMVIERIID